MALPHFLVGMRQRSGAHLFFVLATIAMIGTAVGELFMMRADSVDHFARAARWLHLPIFLVVVSIVGFGSSLFGHGRLWLGLLAVAMRFVLRSR